MRSLVKNYNNHVYNKFVFFKGPLMFVTSMIIESLSPESYVTLKKYKKNIKETLLVKQTSGSIDEWQNDNFVLYNINGLRRSRSQNERVTYAHFFE